jgi:hypothetical protein
VKISPYLLFFVLIIFLVGCPNVNPTAELDPVLSQTELKLIPIGLVNITVSSNAKNTSEPVSYQWSGVPTGVTVETKTQNQFGAQFVFSALEDVLSVTSQPIQLTVSSGALSKIITLMLTVEGKPFFKMVGDFSNLSIKGGEQIAIPITIQRVNQFLEPVHVEAKELPSGVQANNLDIDANSSTGTLTLTAMPELLSLSQAKFNLLATSKSMKLTQLIPLSLNGVPFYKLNVSPQNWQFTGGTQKEFMVSIARYNGFNGAVALHFDALPLGYLNDPTSIPEGSSSTTMVVKTSFATPHQPDGFDVNLIGTGGNINQSSVLHLSTHNPLQTVQFGLSMTVPNVPAPGERVNVKATVVGDLTQRGLSISLVDGRTSLTIPVQNLTMNLHDFVWQDGSYMVDIGFDAPRPQSEMHDYYVNATSALSSTISSVLMNVQSRVQQVLTWVNQTISNIYVHPSCLAAVTQTAITTCGTTPNLFDPEAYQRLGVIPFVDTRTIALPAIAVPRIGYEVGFDPSISWEIVPRNGLPVIGSVTKINGIWYYSAPYNTDSTQPGTFTEYLKASSIEDPVISKSIVFNLLMFRLLEDDNFRWSTTSISDVGNMQLRVNSNYNIQSVPYHLNWSVIDPNVLKSTVGANGSLGQDGCLQPPQLATGTFRDITVLVNVAEIPGLEFRRTIRIDHGVATTNSGCGTNVDGNGWVKY